MPVGRFFLRHDWQAYALRAIWPFAAGGPWRAYVNVLVRNAVIAAASSGAANALA